MQHVIRFPHGDEIQFVSRESMMEWVDFASTIGSPVMPGWWIEEGDDFEEVELADC